MELAVRNLDDALRRILSALSVIGTLWIAAMTMLIVADVTGRAVFASPIFGVPEIVKISVVAIVWLQMPYTLRVGGHLRTGFVLDRLSPRMRAAFDLLACLLGIAVFSAVVWSGWADMIEAWDIGEFEGEAPVRVPTAPIRTITLLGAGLMAVQFVVIALRDIAVMSGAAAPTVQETEAASWNH
jgi:TRAP-type C4-dicarboxylate transport system permease small subunit